MKCIEFKKEEKYIRDFISLAHGIYSRDNNTQNDSELRSLLMEKHPLNKYFTLHKFCIYKANMIVGRFIITTYPEDNSAYIGFFECMDDDRIARFLFDKAETFTRNNGYFRLIGPVDCSFWMKYRLKINLFEKRPYTGEPYNPPYYLKLFLDNGYWIDQRYTSSIYPPVEDSFQKEQYEKRYENFTEKGYRIISPTIHQWNQVVSELYTLISDLYQDFPIYKPISLEDFSRYFQSYQKIIRFDMVKMAYYNDIAVGFYISIPNYHNLVYHSEKWINLFRILNRRRNPKEYVMLYMGVSKEHQGLGKALVQSIIMELKNNKRPSIGALQREGKITQNYVEELIQQRYEYVLLKKEWTNDSIR